MGLGVIVYILILLIFGLIIFSVMQIKMAGMTVKDFITFIEANKTLDRLYEFSKKYDKMTPIQQIAFLKEAEEVFDAFDKVPNILWEDEYQKYLEVLEKYKDIKVIRWNS